MALAFAFFSTTALGGDFLTGDELQKAFCGKTFLEGENFISGWTFKAFYAPKCNEITVHYLTGDKAGQRFTWPLRIYPSGDHCVQRDGKDRCAKFEMVGDGAYHAMRSGKAQYSRAKPVDGNQLD
jgi:hypothetical protein